MNSKYEIIWIQNGYNALNANFITVYNENTNNIEVSKNPEKNDVKLSILTPLANWLNGSFTL